jgi:hypothetical protein
MFKEWLIDVLALDFVLITLWLLALLIAGMTIRDGIREALELIRRKR